VLPWGDTADPVKLFAALLSVEAPPLAGRVPGLPNGVSDIVARALQKAPERRFGSMADVVEALEAVIGAVSTRPSIEIVAMRADLRAAPTLDAAPAPGRSGRVPSSPPQDSTPPPVGASRGGRTRALRAALAAGAALLVAAALVVPRLRPRPPPADPVAPPPAGAPPAATRLADLPLPASPSAEAVAAFRAGMQAFADASFEAARQSWERAVALDGTLAAAHLRLALIDSLVVLDEQDARRAFKNAVHFRAGLSPRDQRLLDGFEPYFQRQPPDLAECERRLAAAAADHPGDAELAFYLGYVRFDSGQLERSLDPFERAVELDPSFALARSNVGGVLAYLGRFSESLDVLDRCLSASPSATDCLWFRVLIHEQAGECEDEERDLRRWIVKDGDDYLAYSMLAKVLFAEGRSLETVTAAYEQKWAKLPEARRKRYELGDRATLAIAKGDFDGAEQQLLALDRLVASEPGELAHAHPARRLVELYLETGRPKLAARVADGYLKKRGAWTEPHRVDDSAISDDLQPQMHAVLLHTGAETAAEFDAFRDRWLASWRAKTSDAYVGHLWIYGFALPAETPAEAERALAARASFPPLPPFLPQTLSLAHVAKASFLAGKTDDALPYLRRATRVCVGLEQPYLHAEAEIQLGSALDQKGDKAGACAAYRAVTDPWGNAKPRSVRAEQARALAAKAGCR
jgi:serine/threonine-protein kinase